MRVDVSLPSSNEHRCCKADGKLDTQGELEGFLKGCIPHTAQTSQPLRCVIVQTLISDWLSLGGAEKSRNASVSFLPLHTGSPVE